MCIMPIAAKIKVTISQIRCVGWWQMNPSLQLKSPFVATAWVTSAIAGERAVKTTPAPILSFIREWQSRGMIMWFITRMESNKTIKNDKWKSGVGKSSDLSTGRKAAESSSWRDVNVCKLIAIYSRIEALKSGSDGGTKWLKFKT